MAGLKLAEQELRNAIYTGPWLSDAKRRFSKTHCPAHGIANQYLKGSPLRQDYLETALNWISNKNIEQYMADNQHNLNASELWLYFQNVINWTKEVFPKYRKEMKGIPLGPLYDKFKGQQMDSASLEIEITKLLKDEDVTKKSGIYTYVLTRDEKQLNIRAFSSNQITEAYVRQEGICTKCKEHFELEEMAADHIVPWSKGGKTTSENCQMLCRHDNGVKSDK